MESSPKGIVQGSVGQSEEINQKIGILHYVRAPINIPLGQNACQDGLWQKVPQNACMTERLGSKAIWEMPKYTTCDKLIHKKYKMFEGFFYFLELVRLVKKMSKNAKI